MSDKFYAVWRDKGGSAPSKRHETKEEAIAEAGRLAQQSNEAYFVLEVVGVVAPIRPAVAYSELAENPEATCKGIGIGDGGFSGCSGIGRRLPRMREIG